MDSRQIYSLIERAINQEHKTSELATKIKKVAGTIHHRFELKPLDSDVAIKNFCVDYVLKLPRILITLDSAALELGIQSAIKPVTSRVYLHFEQLESSKKDLGLYAILACSYFAFRFIEEVNDAIRSFYGIELMPVDFMISNIVIHEILGGDLADDIEDTVFQASDSLLPMDAGNNIVLRQAEKYSWNQIWQSIVNPVPQAALRQ